MVSLFYEVILSSSTNKQSGKYIELNKKWTVFCKSKTNNEQKVSLINIFNEILMLFNEISQEKPQQQNFTE